MTAGYDLREGKFDKSCNSVSDIKRMLQPFFDNSSKKESTYKYAMIQAILDNVEYATPKTYKITFDQLYYRFSEIYWVLVSKYSIPQKAPSVKTPKTLAEKVIESIVGKYQIRRKTDFRSLPNDVKTEIVQQMKRKCSRYVIGALYADTNKIMYSFSKQKEWVKLNPLFVDYAKKHKKLIQMNNYQAWAQFYADIAAIENKDVGYYQRLLKREFSNFTVEDISEPVSGAGEVKTSLKNSNSIQSGYDANMAKIIRKVLMQYPDLGLYLAQICEKVDSDRETVRNILEKAFWCRQEGSRYYYKDISDSDVVEEAVFSEQVEGVHEEFSEKPEVDPEKLRLLDDPEQLIKQLKKEKGIIRESAENHSTAVSNKQPANKTVPKQRKWDREEVVILVTEYFRTKDLSPKEIEESYRKVSEFLRKREEILTGTTVDPKFRNYAGIRLQSSRIQSLDPENKNAGMQGTKMQKEIVDQYLSNPDKICEKAKTIIENYGGFCYEKK